MASAILMHPIQAALAKPASWEIDTYSNMELLDTLELEDPFRMDLEDLVTLINGTDHRGSAVALRSYLVGIYDTLCMLRATRPDLFAS